MRRDKALVCHVFRCATVILVVIVELNSFAHFLEDILEHASLDACGDGSGFESDLVRSKPVIDACSSWNQR